MVKISIIKDCSKGYLTSFSLQQPKIRRESMGFGYSLTLGLLLQFTLHKNFINNLFFGQLQFINSLDE